MVTFSEKNVLFTGRFRNTDRTRLIRSNSLASFCFELSGNSNYIMKLLLYPLNFDWVISRFGNKL